MKPTDVTTKDDWIQYLTKTIEDKDKYIEKLLHQIADLLGKVKCK